MVGVACLFHCGLYLLFYLGNHDRTLVGVTYFDTLVWHSVGEEEIDYGSYY